jgi:hypothetical protein
MFSRPQRIRNELKWHHYTKEASKAISQQPRVVYSAAHTTAVQISENEVLLHMVWKAVLLKTKTWEFIFEMMKAYSFEPADVIPGSVNGKYFIPTQNTCYMYLDSNKKTATKIEGDFPVFFGTFGISLFYSTTHIEFFDFETDKKFKIPWKVGTVDDPSKLVVHGVREDGHLWIGVVADVPSAPPVVDEKNVKIEEPAPLKMTENILYFQVGGISYDLVDIVSYIRDKSPSTIETSVTALLVEDKMYPDHPMVDKIACLNPLNETQIVTPVLYDCTAVSWLKDNRDRFIVFFQKDKVYVIEGDNSVEIYYEPTALRQK